MYQYDDPTVTAIRPASTGQGTPGYFTDGNPAGGQAATILRAEFMNMLMMELVNAITGAGIPLSKSTFTQLKSAIEAYITARTATETRTGIVELATSAETQTGTDALKAVTPAGLSARTATETRTGIVELATSAETQTGTDALKAVTPAGLSARTATETRTGIVELATAAEVQAGTDALKAVTPAGLSAKTATGDRAGIVELATIAETADGLDLARAVTPAGNMAMFTNGRTNNVQPFPGGYKIQAFEVGHAELGNNAGISFTFPAAFTTFCFPILSSTSTLSGLIEPTLASTEGAEITSYTLSGGVITSHWNSRSAGVFRIVAFGR